MKVTSSSSLWSQLWNSWWSLYHIRTRSSWLNCALRDDEAVYWVSIGHYEAVAVGNWWYWVSRGHLCLYILHQVEIWSGVTDGWLTHWQTMKDRATQYHIKNKFWAIVTQFCPNLYSFDTQLLVWSLMLTLINRFIFITCVSYKKLHAVY